MNGIYLDNAATSRKKPAVVKQAMLNYFETIGCSPGRGGYQCSLEASRLVLEARLAVCKLFNYDNPDAVVFTYNITHGLNMIIQGYLNKGDHVITSSMEHNAVVRPLNHLKTKGMIEVDYVSADTVGRLDPKAIENAIRDNTKMIILNHASNVTGTLLPIEEVSRIAKAHDITFLVDTAQTAGSHPIDLQEIPIDILAFTGHKGLFGPTGTGGLIIQEQLADAIDSLYQGGTGSISEKDYQPAFLPDKFESGTTNTLGIVGLKAGIEYLLDVGVETIHDKKNKLTQQFLEGLKTIDKIKVYSPGNIDQQTSTISIGVEGMDLGELSFRLDDEYDIMTRSGLHCAPYAHQTIGTYPEGTLRFSIGYFNTAEDIEQALAALKELVV
jgi:cysteine desulfurase family protein